MKVISLNVGMPREFEWQGKPVLTSIFKYPVNHKCKVSFLNIEGDYQSDQVNHGGKDKAVYSYDISYYDDWKKQLARDDWEPGIFGENLTTQGFTDEKIKIGNVYKIGTVQVRAIQPRFPYFKLNIRFDRTDMIDKFYNGKGFGIYFRVEEEGEFKVNDTIELVEESFDSVSIEDVTYCKISKGKDQNKLRQILETKHLPEKLKNSFKVYLT